MNTARAFNQDVANRICARLALGQSLQGICELEGMPNVTTVLSWVATNAAFASLYAASRQLQADHLADEVLAIADSEGPDVARDRLRIEARQWLAGKLAPKKYGSESQ